MTAHLSSEARAEMRARAEAARLSDAPWTIIGEHTESHMISASIRTATGRDVAYLGADDYEVAYVGSTLDDAEFIAHAREDIPALLADLDATEGAIARVRYDAERVLAVEMGNYPDRALAAFATRILAALDADAAAGGES